MTQPSRRAARSTRFERILDAPATRLILSFLIIVSVLPEATLEGLLGRTAASALPLVLLAVFLPELGLRVTLWVRRGCPRSELWLLALDTLAVATFLPLHQLGPGFAGLRLLRLARLLLLIGYWSRTLGELWRIVGDRERRDQVALVLATGALLALAAAVVLANLGVNFDYDEDGALDQDDRRFLHILWWTLLQVQDPGNIVRSPAAPLLVLASLVLTLAGVLLFTFLVGVGTTAVEELVRRARTRAPGLEGHTVVLALGNDPEPLVGELAALYAKNQRPFRCAVLSRTSAPPGVEPARRRTIARRLGDPLEPSDLRRVDLATARRAVLVSSDESDSAVLAGILAVRTVNTAVALFAVVEHERDFAAARHAGGHGTTVVGASSFLGHVLAHTVADPASKRLLDDLLTPQGCEVYTYIFDRPQRMPLEAAEDVALATLRRCGWGRATILGVLLAPPGREAEDLDDDSLEIVLDPRHTAKIAAGRLRGLVAVARSFEDLRELALDVVRDPHGTPTTPRLDPGGGPLAMAQPPAAGHVLVCGASARLPRLVRRLFDSAQATTIDIVVREANHASSVFAGIRAALAGHLPGIPGERALPFTVHIEGDAYHLRVDGLLDAEPRAAVSISVLDWTDPVHLLENGRLGRAQTVLIAPGLGEVAEPDGQVALETLRLAELVGRGGLTHPELRVVAVVDDPVRADLLAERLTSIGQQRFQVYSATRVRDRYVVQSLFVRGLTRVMLDLLGPAGAHLERHRLLAPPQGTVAELALGLAAQHQVLVAIELGDGSLLMDPCELAAADAVVLADARAIWLICHATC